MRPRERIYEMQGSDVTDAGRSNENDNMHAVWSDYIHTTHIPSI